MLRARVLQLTTPAPSNPPDTDFDGVAVPGGARHWVVNPADEFQYHDGWGVLAQIGQTYPAVNDSTPPWQDEVCEKLVELGISIMGQSIFLGLSHSDMDAFTAWQLANFASGTAQTDYNNRRHTPINTANWYYSSFDWHQPIVGSFKAAAEAAGVDWKWYLKVNSYYGSQADVVGGYDPASFPARAATTVKKLWDHVAANYAASVGYPFALDSINETHFGPASTGNTPKTWLRTGTEIA